MFAFVFIRQTLLVLVPLLVVDVFVVFVFVSKFLHHVVLHWLKNGMRENTNEKFKIVGQMCYLTCHAFTNALSQQWLSIFTSQIASYKKTKQKVSLITMY
jgi:hypothetical protein